MHWQEGSFDGCGHGVQYARGENLALQRTPITK